MSNENEEVLKLPPTLSGATLRLWRERMGYSQREACEQLGCSRGAWAGWEDGTHVVPRYVGLALAALALGMEPYGGSAPAGKAA
jgi:transcriptional regulator with XRE-family HTH domain